MTKTQGTAQAVPFSLKLYVQKKTETYVSVFIVYSTLPGHSTTPHTSRSYLVSTLHAFQANKPTVIEYGDLITESATGQTMTDI